MKQFGEDSKSVDNVVMECPKEGSLEALTLPKEIQEKLEELRLSKIARWKQKVMNFSEKGGTFPTVPYGVIDFSGRNLSGLNLMNANLKETSLKGGADLEGVDFTNVKLSGVEYDDEHVKTLTLSQLTQMCMHPENLKDKIFSDFFGKCIEFQLAKLEKTNVPSGEDLLALLDCYSIHCKHLPEDKKYFSIFSQETSFFKPQKDFSKTDKLSDTALLQEAMQGKKAYDEIKFNGAIKEGVLGRIDALWKKVYLQNKNTVSTKLKMGDMD